MSDPLISVVVPVHDEGAWLAGCLDSLLAQSHPRVEIVVIDDGSRDDSLAVARRYEERGVRVFAFPETRGEGAARGKGVAESTGAFIVQVDADAIFPPDFLERGLAHFKKDAGLGAIALGYLKVHPARKGLIADYFRAKRAASHALRAAGNKDEVAGFFMYRRDVIDKVGSYDPSFPGGTDLDFGKRVKAAGIPYAWAADTWFWHADPEAWGEFLRRTFNGSLYWKKAYVKHGMWPTGRRRALLFTRTIFVSLLPAYLLLALLDPWWLVPALAALALESVVPVALDPESRAVLGIALRKRQWLLALALPAILFTRLRASAYGKVYADLVPSASRRSNTFDV